MHARNNFGWFSRQRHGAVIGFQPHIWGRADCGGAGTTTPLVCAPGPLYFVGVLFVSRRSYKLPMVVGP